MNQKNFLTVRGHNLGRLQTMCESIKHGLTLDPAARICIVTATRYHRHTVKGRLKAMGVCLDTITFVVPKKKEPVPLVEHGPDWHRKMWMDETTRFTEADWDQLQEKWPSQNG